MRTLVFLAFLAAVGLVITGAIKLQKTEDQISIQIDENLVEQDARLVIEEGKELVRRAESAVQHTPDSIQK